MLYIVNLYDQQNVISKAFNIITNKSQDKLTKN